MNIKSTIVTVVAFLTATAGSYLQAKDFETSASATLVSQYLFRGFDLSQEDPALQADFTFEHKSGFSGGVWASNYDVGVDDGVEIDLFASYGFGLSDNVTLSLGFIEYTYTGDNDSSTEYNVSLSIGNFGLTYYDDVDLDVTYLDLSVEFEVTKNGNITLHAGRNDPDDGESNNDFSIGYSHDFSEALTGFITYSNNDLDVDGAEDYLIGGVTYSF